MATRTRTSVDLMRTSNLPFYFSCISSTMRQIYVFFFFGGCLLPYFHARILLFPFTPFFFFSFPSCFYWRQTDVHRPFLFVVCSFFFCLHLLLCCLTSVDFSGARLCLCRQGR